MGTRRGWTLKALPEDADTVRVHPRVRRLAAAIVVAIAATTTAATTAVAGSSEEARFVSLMNASRASAGLAPLAVASDLIDDARRHTAAMIERGDIFHSSDAELAGAASGWTLLGENVGMGPNPDILHQAFMASPSHRANILGAFNYVGVGTGVAEDGTMFVTVIFMQKPVPASAPTSTTATTTTTLPTPAVPVTTVATASPRPPAAPPRHPVPQIVRWGFIEGTVCVELGVYGRVCVE